MKPLTVDQDLCISCSLCVDLFPEFFRMNQAGLSEVINTPAAESSDLQEAMESCPVACIRQQE